MLKLSRIGLLLASTLTIAGVFACDAPQSNSESHSSPPSPLATSEAPAASASATYPDLQIPAKDQILVATLHGTRDATTPSFAITERKYTIRVNCVGTGTISTGGKRPQEVPCDGKQRRLHVATDAKTTVVKVHVNGSVRWSVAVVVSEDFQVAPASATNSDSTKA